MSKTYEAGVRPNRIEFVRESTEGVAPANPSWNKYADVVRTLEPSISGGTQAQRGLGNPHPNDHNTGPESHQLSVAYDFQQWLVDGSSNAQDAAYDGLVRDADNNVPNTHTVVRRMDQSSLETSNTINGSTSYDTRQYLVGKGGTVATTTIEVDPSDANPVTVTLEYEFEKLRLYQLDQPDSATNIAVKSTDSGDTSQSVTIQGADGTGTNQEESITLNGTTAAGSTNDYASLDAVELDTGTAGDVEVYIDTDSTSTVTLGDQLAVIRGQNVYDHGEGDLGIPALGSGSHASDIGSAYEQPPQVTIERPDGTTVADEVATSTITVENALNASARTETGRPAIAVNNATLQAETTVFGEVEHYASVDEMLRAATDNLRHEFNGGTLQLDSATVMESSAAEEAEQDKKEVDITWEGQGVQIL